MAIWILKMGPYFVKSTLLTVFNQEPWRLLIFDNCLSCSVKWDGESKQIYFLYPYRLYPLYKLLQRSMLSVLRFPFVSIVWSLTIFHLIKFIYRPGYKVTVLWLLTLLVINHWCVFYLLENTLEFKLTFIMLLFWQFGEVSCVSREGWWSDICSSILSDQVTWNHR